MSLLVDSLRQYWLPGVANAEAALTLTLSDWVKGGGFYVKELPSATAFTLQLSSAADVANLFAATANRTFSGCFESVVSISEVQKVPRSLAWLMIKLYYAAFFGAHGHMRTCGVSCANLDAVDAVRIYELARLQGLNVGASKINSGQYLVRFDVTSLTLSFLAVQASGSHEALWITYKAFLERIIETAPTLIPIQQQRDLVVEKLRAANVLLGLKGSNGGNWLSRMRNLVQYRHSHGVWYPYSLDKASSAKLLSRTATVFKSSPDTFRLEGKVGRDAAEIETFYEGALFISSIARRTTLDLAARSAVKSSISKRGAITFLKLCEMD